MKIIFVSPNNPYSWIEIDSQKISDLSVGNHYAGCRCSISNRGETGECKAFNDCLNSVLASLSLEDYTYLKKYFKTKLKLPF